MSEQTQANTLPDIRQTSVFNAPVQKVWTAVSTSEGIASWFMPPLDFVLEVGHEFQLDSGPYGKSPCKVTVVDPPNRLSFKWGKDWTLTFELAEKGDQTEFTLIHSGWTAGMPTEFGEPHEVVRERMNGGWVGIAQKLGAYVEA